MNRSKVTELLVFLPLIFLASISVASAELIHNFQSPAFIPGNGFSQHVLTIHQLEEAKKKELKVERDAAIAKAETAAKSTNLAKFLVNVEARITPSSKRNRYR
jgi:hypothetical protein